MISFILVQHNHPDLTLQAIESLRRHEVGSYEVIVVDNGSSEPGAASVGKSCTFIANTVNRGWGSANNQGAAASTGELLLFLNNDTIVNGPLADPITGHFERHPRVGAIAVPLQNGDGTPQVSSGCFPSIRTELAVKRGVPSYPSGHVGSVEWATGAALAVRRDVFDRVRGFDEGYGLYFEDVDLCRRIHHAGFDIHLIRCAPVTHLGGGRRPAEKEAWIHVEYRRSQLRYYSLHNSVMENIILRVYLFLKCAAWLLRGRGHLREVALRILPLLIRRADASA